MSDTIVTKIRRAEEDASKRIERIRREAQGKIVQTRKDLEAAGERHEAKSREHLKEFRKITSERYRAETGRLKREGAASQREYARKLEARFGEILGRIESLVRKELCL